MLRTRSFVAVQQMAICPEPSDIGCGDSPALFAEQTSPFFYEVIVFAETNDTQPLRQVFTIGPAA